MTDEQIPSALQSEPQKCALASLDEMIKRMERYHFLDDEISVFMPFLEEYAEGVLEQVCSFFILIEQCVRFCKEKIIDSKICFQHVLTCIFATEEDKVLFQECLEG
ncbi:MAG: hypothetical protein HON29_01810 [Candidatus Magasanikbacteria bacterium]|nr:hypothetical protein [Candidatus Magasanikbacteria bacterium]